MSAYRSQRVLKRLPSKVSVLGALSLFAAHLTFLEVALMDLGFSTHAFHSSSRLVFMDAHLSVDRTSLTITSPPNNRVFPPGPGTLLYISCHRSLIILDGTPSLCFLDCRRHYQRRNTRNGRNWGLASCERPRYWNLKNVNDQNLNHV